MTLSPNGSPLFIELGQRPDEEGPPIGGESLYPADVTARLETSARDIIARYPKSRSALLPLLHLVQSEDGYLTKAGLAFCAAQLDLTEAEVSQARLEDVALHGSTIDGLQGVAALRGATISPDQVMALALPVLHAAGITVTDAPPE